MFLLFSVRTEMNSFWLLLFIVNFYSRINIFNIVFSNMIRVVSDNILRICIQESLLILKFRVLLQTLSEYNNLLVAKKFTRLVQGNICVQDEDMVNPMYTLALIQHHVERISYKTNLSYQIVSPYY